MNAEQNKTAITADVPPTAVAQPLIEPNETASTSLFLAIGIALVAALIRLDLLPHPWNFTPLIALSLFGGARLRSWQAFMLPLLLMVVTDFLLWKLHNYAPFNPWVYGCYAFTILLGFLLRRTRSWWRIGASAVVASVLFFLVTNFGVWYVSRKDPQTLPAGAGMVWETEGTKYPGGKPRYADNELGLMVCYFMGAIFSAKVAQPFGFAGNELAGDLFFTGLLFGAQAWAAGRVSKGARRLQAPAQN